MKKLIGLIFFAVFLYIGLVSGVSAQEKNCTGSLPAGDSTHKCVDMKGYAWGADNSPFGGVGWINFNNTSTGSNTASSLGTNKYWVEFDRNTKELKGYAWSERYGYIRFGGFSSSSFPSQSACQSSNCNAQLVQSGAGYQLIGYARFCFVYQKGCDGNIRTSSELGGFDGWIAFKVSSGGVSYGTSANKFSGFAWGGGSGDTTNQHFGEGAGWIKMDPSNGGVSCVVSGQGNCLEDGADTPIVTLTANSNEVSYNGDVTLSWSITNIPNGCSSIATSSTPNNSTWNNYKPSGTSIASGSKNIGTITGPTTFTISCTYNGKTGSADTLVTIKSYTPVVTLTAPSQVNYGDNATLNYTVTSIPYGCTAQLYKNESVSGSAISITGDGTEAYTKSGSITVNNLTLAANWKFQCTDSTSPSPARIGSATAKTTVYVPTPILNLDVKSNDTGSTTTIPCSNTGVEITYSTKDVKSGSCYAAGNSGVWDKNTNITENTYPTNQTITTGSISYTPNVGGLSFQLICKKTDGTEVQTSRTLFKSCTPGNLSVTAAAACVTPSENININYVGSGFTSNSCSVSWKSSPNNKINSGNFNLNYIEPASNKTVGQSYTYTVSGCQESAYPNNSPVSQSTVVEVQNSCGTTTPCTGLRCNSGKGPTFKEF